ncbi:hypothetical protein U1Q18_006674 [Sarracenia purpurea var. burkii]
MSTRAAKICLIADVAKFYWLSPCTRMKRLTMPEAYKTTQFSNECWFDDDVCILDIDYFVKTLSTVKAKGVRPDLIGSIITHYACKWLPELSAADGNSPSSNFEAALPGSTTTATASWMKKRFFVETLVGILPQEKDSIPCNFLLRLLRAARVLCADPSCRTELEKRVSWQLEQATLNELMIPSFSHACGTLLDVELVLRLVKRFVNLDQAVRSGAALMKVAKLVDGYLAEAAVDSKLSLPAFIGLAGALPCHARSTDDGLYRAIDTYLKAHPGVSKQERKALCRLMDIRKLSPEASHHAVQNERLPVRAAIQVLLSEQTKFNRPEFDFTGSFSGTRSPSLAMELPPARWREVAVQQAEIERLRKDVRRLQSQCVAMNEQIERLLEKKKSKGWFFIRWQKMGITAAMKSDAGRVAGKVEASDGESEHGGIARPLTTPMSLKTKMVKGKTCDKWRISMS